jgi:4-amino-4-deoxy-L-arabinose transferase
MNLLIYIGLIATPFFLSSDYTQHWIVLLPFIAILISIYYTFGKLTNDRIVASLSIVFTVNLIVFSSFFLRQNSLQVNGIMPLSSFIEKNNFIDRDIIVYDELLPALAFELDKQIISVYDGNRSLQRETQFEKNDSWKNQLFDISDPNEKKKLEQLLTSKSILVLRTKKISKMKVVLGDSWQAQDFGKWTLYYN